LDYSRALEQEPGNMDALYNRGYVYLINKKYDEAIEDFSKVIENHPFDADAYNNLGMACYYKGEVNRAVALLYKSLELDPNSNALKNLNLIQKKKK